MKIAVGRGPGRHGGIFRRFRALADYCRGRHDMVGLLLLGDDDAPLDDPVRTWAFSRRHLPLGLMRASSIDEVLAACEPTVRRVAERLTAEAPDRVLAADTDLKGLCVIEACRRAGLPVTTHVASVAHMDAAFERRASTRYMEAVERFCLQRSDRLIFPSRFAEAFCAERVPNMAPATVVYNGIAQEFLDAPETDRDPARIGAVMRLSRIKNPETLGRIARALRTRGFELDVIANRDGAKRFPELFAHARFLPQTMDGHALAAFHAGRRAIVSPSHFEASGNVPMEALASGTPAVVTATMGVAEILRGLGRGDLVVEVNDVDGAVERLTTCAPVAPGLRARLRSEFAWPIVCARLLSALSSD